MQPLKQRSGGPVGLRFLPVTQEIAGSSPVQTAEDKRRVRELSREQEIAHLKSEGDTSEVRALFKSRAKGREEHRAYCKKRIMRVLMGAREYDSDNVEQQQTWREWASSWVYGVKKL